MRLGLTVAAVVVATTACGAAPVSEPTTAATSGSSTSGVVTTEGVGSVATSSTTATTAVAPAGYPEPSGGEVDRWVPEVVATHPHDVDAFTQGLVVVGHSLFESTGIYGRSSIREVAIGTGEVVTRASLSPGLFGEGLALVGERLVQLTWREETAIVWTPELSEVGRFSYEGEGWGLCDLDDRLAMSDGTSTLAFRDPQTFDLLEAVPVTLAGAPIELLNELECVGGYVFANVWKSTDILVIEPDTGVVTAVIDASGLDEWSADNSAAVLNGIAYDEASAVFYLTGKLWPVLYEVVFVAE